VDALPSFRELTVAMDDETNAFHAWLAIYYLSHKHIRLVSARFEPSVPLSFEEISRDRPLMLEGYGCEAIGHAETVTIPALGCVLLAPPSMALDTPYRFNETFLFVGLNGLGSREPEGRWNNGSTVHLTLTIDLKRIWAYQDMYVNLLVSPFVPPGTPRQRFRISWGADRHAEVSLTGRDRISLPVRREDWSGERVWTLPITIDLPDALEPPWMYTPKGQPEGRGALAALFEEVSISAAAGGRAVIAGP
jgi:hypothetical protein